MRANELRSRTGASEANLKEWVRRGVVLPVGGTRGPGNRAEYDDANVIAVTVAQILDELHVAVARYAPAFSALHEGLRSTYGYGWQRLSVTLTPHAIRFVEPADVRQTALGCIIVDLEKLSTVLVTAKSNPQLQLTFVESPIA